MRRGSAIILAGMLLAVECTAAPDDTLAVVGTRVITASAFAKKYEARLTTTGITDNIDTRRAYLENLVRDELLILKAKREGLDRTPEAVRHSASIRDQELLNAYTRHRIVPAVTVSESDRKAFYLMLNTKVRVRHLFAPTREKAEALARELRRGRTFQALAKETFTDPRLRDSGGDLGYIEADEMDPEFEKAAFALAIGETSAPVKTVQGYSIIRAEDRKGNPFMTEYEYARSKERLSAFVRKRKTEEAAKAFAARLRERLALRIDHELLGRVRAQLMAVPAHARADEAPGVSHASADTAAIVIRSKAGVWSVRHLLEMLEGSFARQKRWVKTDENFSDYVAGLFMRRYIIAEAVAEGLDTTAEFRESVDYAFETYLQSTLEELLKKAIDIPEQSLRSYYTQHQDRFAVAPTMRLSAILVSDSSAADSVRRALVSGASFESIARRVSIQKATAARGGDMGFFRNDELGSFAARIFALQQGAWTGPLTDEGKHVFVKRTDYTPLTYRSYDEAKEEIRMSLRSERWYASMPRMVDDIKKSIECRVYPERVTSMTISHNYH